MGINSNDKACKLLKENNSNLSLGSHIQISSIQAIAPSNALSIIIIIYSNQIRNESSTDLMTKYDIEHLASVSFFVLFKIDVSFFP